MKRQIGNMLGLADDFLWSARTLLMIVVCEIVAGSQADQLNSRKAR